MPRGFYLALEGPSRSGKTTQRDKLVTFWKQRYYRSPVVTREPGAGPGQSRIADSIRDVVQGETAQAFSERMHPWAEACLYAASRAQTLPTVVMPALESGHDVVSDRCHHSSGAFQGGGRGLGMGNVHRLNMLALMRVPPTIPELHWDDVVLGEISECIHERFIVSPSRECLNPSSEFLLYMACESQATGQFPHSFPADVDPYRIPRDMLTVPDLVLHLDISPEEIFRRQLDVRGDKFEAMEMEFHEKVRTAYFRIRGANVAKLWVTVNGDPDPGLTPEQLANEVDRRKDHVFRQIISAIEPHLPQS